MTFPIAVPDYKKMYEESEEQRKELFRMFCLLIARQPGSRVTFKASEIVAQSDCLELYVEWDKVHDSVEYKVRQDWW